MISCEEIFYMCKMKRLTINWTRQNLLGEKSVFFLWFWLQESLGFWFWKKKTIKHGISNRLPEVKVSWWQYKFYFIKNILDIVTALTWFRVLMLTEMIFRVRQRKYPAMISTLAFFRNADLEVCLKVAFTSFQAIFNTLNPGWTFTFKKAR